jgi:hypothetical protein
MELIKSHVATFYARAPAHFQSGDVICCVWDGRMLAEREVHFEGYFQETHCFAMIDPKTGNEDGDYIYEFRVIDYSTHRLETLEAD